MMVLASNNNINDNDDDDDHYLLPMLPISFETSKGNSLKETDQISLGHYLTILEICVIDTNLLSVSYIPYYSSNLLINFIVIVILSD